MEEELGQTHLRVAKILRELGLSLDMSSFSERLRKQKVLRTLQLLGVGEDYWFTWYRDGPYCPGLAEELFAIHRNQEAIEGRLGDIELDQETAQAIETLKEALRPHMDDSDMLEAIGSAAHFVERGLSPTDAVERIRHLKPYLEVDAGKVETVLEGLQG